MGYGRYSLKIAQEEVNRLNQQYQWLSNLGVKRLFTGVNEVDPSKVRFVTGECLNGEYVSATRYNWAVSLEVYQEVLGCRGEGRWVHLAFVKIRDPKIDFPLIYNLE